MVKSIQGQIKLIGLVILVLMHEHSIASGASQIPTVCRERTHDVALIDCLQSQLEILQHVLNYHQTVAKITGILSEQDSHAPSAIEPAASDSNPTIDRINWFDQHLQIYAIVGSPDKLTALARLDGRQFRLQEGDSIRLARVKEVHPRGLKLVLSGHEISIGLSGRSNNPFDQVKSGVQ